MPLRIHVHAAIWVDDTLVVNRGSRRAREHVTLPGGRVKSREAITDALIREVREGLGCEITVGDLLLVAEVVNATSRQDVVLIFAAGLISAAGAEHLDRVDPKDRAAASVMPPVLAQLAQQRRDGHTRPRWLGNLHEPRPRPRGG